MNRAPWVALAYGYVVALIAVVLFIVGMFNFVGAAFDRANPLRSSEGFYGPFGGPMTSFEGFRAMQMEQRLSSRASLTAVPPPGDTLSTPEQRKQYDALRNDRIAQVRFSASRRMVTHGLLLLLAVGLFTTHWRWIRRQREAPDV